ncbi:MAG: hypothetical protein KAY37_01350 [Phycisphaerae bacterium]|nr:hypothetical protein [Phycisphaerae bacterium]
MHPVDTLRECFKHNEWTRGKLLVSAAELSLIQHEVPLEMPTQLEN